MPRTAGGGAACLCDPEARQRAGGGKPAEVAAAAGPTQAWPQGRPLPAAAVGVVYGAIGGAASTQPNAAAAAAAAAAVAGACTTEMGVEQPLS